MTAAHRILLIGPLPPPTHGTSVPFKIFCDHVMASLPIGTVRVVDSNSGDKAVTPLLSARTIRAIVAMCLGIVMGSRGADRIIIFGSQRFATVVGSMAIVFLGCFRRRVYIRFFGGGYDMYFESLPFPIKKVVAFVFRRAGGLIFQTGHLARTMRPIWPDNIHAESNYRKLGPTTAPVMPQDSRRSALKYLYTGVVRREKGIKELIEAFGAASAILSKTAGAPSIHLEIYGPVYDDLPESLLSPQTLERFRISHHGEVDQAALQNAYRGADVFVFPSYWRTEGHSGSLIEALMSGLPIISTDWRANSELIEDGVNGMLCKPQDVASLAECIVRIALDPALRARLTSGALASAKKFDAEQVCPRLLKVICGTEEAVR